MSQVRKNIKFLNSYKADISIIPTVIDQLINDLQTINYPQSEIDEIVIAMDEAITNAVQETLSKLNDFPAERKNKNVIIRYSIIDDIFDSTIIDHGKGLDISKMLKTIPDSDSENYHQQVIEYAHKAEKKKLKIRMNGQEIILNGIGAGLKIMLAYMDTVTIDLIDKEQFISNSVSNYTDGTILNIKRKRRY